MSRPSTSFPWPIKLRRGCPGQARACPANWREPDFAALLLSQTLRIRSVDFHSVDQPPVERGQKLVVEDIGRLRPLLELEVFRDLLDRALEARRIDAADAIALDVAGQDIVAQEGAQALELLFARAVV